MLYWLHGINAPNWLYVSQLDRGARKLASGQRVDVPAGFLLFPAELAPPAPERWVRRMYDVHRYRVAPAGGHFPAMENGPLLVQELRDFFRPFRRCVTA